MRWLKYFLIALAFVPFTAQAVTTIPWSITNLTDTFIFPNLVNGSAKGILVSGSSTINANLSVSTLTAGNCVQAGVGGVLTTIAGACGTSGGSITAVTATNPLFSSGGTSPNISTIFSTTSNFGIGTDGFVYTNHAGLPVTAASSSFFGYTPVPPTRSITVNGTANQVSVTGGTQDLSADRTWTAALTSHTIFPSGGYESLIGSTTNATSTNFAITGAAANCNGTNALTTNSTGVVGCTAQPQGTVTAVSVASANGFAGSSSGGATPALTLTTTITAAVLKGNGTAISAAANGTDYTLITAKTCTAGDFVSAVTAAGVFTCTTPAGTTYTGTFPIVVTGSVISTLFSTTTNSGMAAGNLYVGSGGIFQTAATGTVSNGTGISVTAGQSVIGSGLTITNTSPLSGLTTAFPLSFSNPALSWIGLATSSTLSQGGALYATGVNTIASTPTTTVTCTGSASCTQFAVFGASPITINASGGSSFGYPFTNPTAFGTTTAATTTPLWAQLGLFASSTSYIASTTFAINGNVGIGTTSPSSKLTVVQTDPNVLTTAFTIDGVTAGAGAEMALNRGTNASEEANIDFNTQGVEYWQLGMQNNSTNDFELWDGNDRPVFTIKTATNRVGFGSTTPFGDFAIDAEFGDVLPGNLIFNIASSSLTGTTSVFQVNNIGQLVLPLLTGTQCLHEISGVVSGTGSDCGSGGGSAFPFTPMTNFGALANATGTPLWFQAGFQASSTSRIGSTTFDGVSGNVSIGTPTVSSLLTVSKQPTIQAPVSGSIAQFVGQDGNPLRLTFDTNNSANTSGTAFMFRNSGGTAATPAATTLGSILGSLNFRGYGTTAYAAGSTGLMSAKAEALFTDTSMPTAITFDTTQTNSVTATERLRISGSGMVGIATTSPFARFAIQANPNDSTFAGTLFAIGSSTATATTTLFSISNVGDVIHRFMNTFSLFDRFNTEILRVNAASTTGSIFTVAATTSPSLTSPIKLFDVDQYGHQTASSTNALPTFGTCTGGATFDANSNDVTGGVTLTTAVTSCAIVFANAYAATPEVFLTGANTVSFPAVTTRSTTGFTIGVGAAVTGDHVSYYVVQP